VGNIQVEYVGGIRGGARHAPGLWSIAKYSLLEGSGARLRLYAPGLCAGGLEHSRGEGGDLLPRHRVRLAELAAQPTHPHPPTHPNAPAPTTPTTKHPYPTAPHARTHARTHARARAHTHIRGHSPHHITHLLVIQTRTYRHTRTSTDPRPASRTLACRRPYGRGAPHRLPGPLLNEHEQRARLLSRCLVEPMRAAAGGRGVRIRAGGCCGSGVWRSIDKAALGGSIAVTRYHGLHCA
jgi:hypothetical protein